MTSPFIRQSFNSPLYPGTSHEFPCDPLERTATHFVRRSANVDPSDPRLLTNFHATVPPTSIRSDRLDHSQGKRYPSSPWDFQWQTRNEISYDVVMLIRPVRLNVCQLLELALEKELDPLLWANNADSPVHAVSASRA